MATEGIDIVVTKSGADEAAASVAAIGDAGQKAASGVDVANASIGFMKDAVAATVPPIEQMNSALAAQEGMIRAAQAAADRSGQTLDQYNQKTQDFINGTNAAASAQEQATTTTQQAEEATEKHTEATKALGEATSFLREALTAVGLAFGADKIIELTEQFQKTQIQMQSVSATSKDLADNTKALYDISQLTGSSFAANVSSFQKLSTETSSLGISQKDLLDTLRNVDAVVQESGGTSAQASEAVNLFGRALATGSVQGRQFRTILLDFPQLGQLVASGLHTSTQALTSQSQTAQTASKDFVTAFNSAASAANVAGQEIELTLGGAITTLGNALLTYVGSTESANGFTQLLSNTIAGLARNFSTVATVIEVGITAWASYYAVLVVIPGVFTLITSSIEALTVAVAANPLGFLIVALTTIIALVYQFGNSINVTSDGSITLLGAVIGLWNVLKTVIENAYTFLSTTFGPYFSVLGSIISAAFNGAVSVVSSFVSAIASIFPSLQPLSDALNALSNPLTTFKGIVVDAMTTATTQLNTTKDSTVKLGAALGDGSDASLTGAAKKTSSAIGDLNSSMQTWKDSMGQTHPLLLDLVDAQKNYDDATKQAADSLKAYNAEVDATQAKIQSLALTTQNAMGDMVTATDEWARRSGADFNAVSGSSSSAASSTSATADAVSSAATSQASSSSSSSSSGGGGGGQPGQFTGFLGQFGMGFDYFLSNGKPQPGDSWAHLLQEAENIQNQTQRAMIVNYVKGLATAQGITLNEPNRPGAPLAPLPGFKTGGDFEVGGVGGADSQLVQFYATPGEQVSVKTPSQSASSVGGRAIVVNMNVSTPDANSFRRSQNQTLLSLQSKLNGALNGLS